MANELRLAHFGLRTANLAAAVDGTARPSTLKFGFRTTLRRS